MNLNIEKTLFEIPDGLEFPFELCHHLRTKLSNVIEQNCHLKAHVTYLDKEVLELRKYKLENQHSQTNVQQIQVISNDESPSYRASKIVELSKKNRDMTAQVESLKTKLKKVGTENEKLRSLISTDQEDEDNTISNQLDNTPTDGDEILSSSNRLSQLTSKMMEYRRQTQQLRLELKTALRALSQEVGEPVTPQSVLSVVSSSSWRGRQQTIMALQQKVVDLQIKLANKQQIGLYTDVSAGGDCDASFTCSEVSSLPFTKLGSGSSSFISVSSSAVPLHRVGLVQQDMKKRDQIRKMNEEIETLSQDLKSRQHDLKASKARIHTLENQAKTYRNQIDLADAKLQEKELEMKTNWDELNKVKQELITVKDREKKNKDKSSLEIQEINRALTRERVIVGRLQQVIDEKQEAVQKADIEIIALKNKLELCCSKVAGGMNVVERLNEYEYQLRNQSKLLASNEKERIRISELVDQSVAETERERSKVVTAQKEASQAYFVLQQANKCIDDCLDVANIIDPNLLQEVENIRTMIRELKTGELHTLDNGTKGLSCKKLKAKVELLQKEVNILQANFQEVTEARKNVMEAYGRIYEDLKREMLSNSK